MESLGPNSVVVNRVYRGYPIRIREYEFPGDLIELSFGEFDVILGIGYVPPPPPPPPPPPRAM